MNKARVWIGHLYYTPHCSGETKWVLTTPCVTHLGVNTDRGYTWSFKHLRRHCFQSWFPNYDLLSNAKKANLCYERLVSGSKVLGFWTKTKQSEPSQPGKRLLWPGLIIAERKSYVSATPQPLERFLFGNLYKLLILLLHGTQSGYLHAGAKPESSVKADINRYSIETSIRSRLALRLLVFLCKSITLVWFFSEDCVRESPSFSSCVIYELMDMKRTSAPAKLCVGCQMEINL